MHTNLASIKRGLRKGGLLLRKNSPHIMMGGGAIGIIAGTVLACLATKKVPETMVDHEDALVAAQTEPDSISAVKRVYFSTIFKFIKLYGPAAIAIILGFVLIFCSHGIMVNRNAVLASELLAATQALNAYRSRVTEANDYKVDGVLMNKDFLDTNTNEVYESSNINRLCVKYMDKESSSSWVKGNIDMNLANVKIAQSTAQRRLEVNGYLLLNEVLDLLSMPLVRDGYTHGWIDEPGVFKIVDFRPTVISGTYNPETEACEPYTNDDTRIRLDFNIDGYILDQLKMSKT